MYKNHDKKDIALEFLNDALKHFYDDQSFYSALNLAGAAEKIFAKILQVENDSETTAMEELLDSAVGISQYLNEDHQPSSEKAIRTQLNQPKNSTKHAANASRLNVRDDASQMLDRAIINFYKLRKYVDLPESELIKSHHANCGGVELTTS